MKPDRNMSVEAVAAMFSHVMPVLSDQRLIFTLLVDAITYCEKLGTSCWSITISDRGLRLNVGAVEAMTWGFNYESDLEDDAKFSNSRLLLAGADCLNKIEKNDEVGFIEELSYRPVGAPHWCYNGSFQISESNTPDPSRARMESHLSILRSNHHQFLKLACTTSTGKLRKSSNFSQHHCEAVYQYALSVIKKDVGGKIDLKVAEEISLDEAVLKSIKDGAERRQARLAVAQKLPERMDVTTTAFRRNPDVIAEVLLRAVGHCEMCSKPAPFMRASNGTPYLEVHHRVQLALGGEDTVANALALCPNCHRAAHHA